MLDLDELELKKIYKKDRMVEKYMEEIVRVNNNPEFQAFMTYEEDQEKIQNSRIRAGVKRGIEQGIEKGMKQGIKQGKEEERLQIAKNLKLLETSAEDIAKATFLTIEEIEKL